MRSFQNPKWVAILIAVWLSIISAPGAIQAAGEPASSTAEMLADSELHDVLFLDPDRGWAVGDRGVIWQTESGGRRWQLIDSPTTARLRSIFFADPQHGWIVGGWIHPYTHRSSAVLLHTDNGGRKWVAVDVSLLPALRHVHFTDARNGWAFGDCSALYSTGCFRTRDGGFTWESPPGLTRLSCSTGAVIDSRRAFLVAADSSAWSFANGTLVPVVGQGESGWQPRAVRISGSRGWLVGERGLVQRSEDGGLHWSSPTGKLPAGAAAEFDWQTVAVSGEQCWIAGTPGSCVLNSSDGGRSWRTFRTGQSLPINQLHFLDEQHGWAVGSMGRVLATRDGGQTWRVQHSAGERAALLAVHGNEELVPLEILAKVAADEGYLAVTTVLDSKQEQIAGAAATLQDRLRDACSAVGVTATQSHTLLPRQPMADSRAGNLRPRESNSQLDSRSSELLERLIVRQLRTWRPDVVLTENISGRQHHSPSRLNGQMVVQAVQRAADPAAFPDQIVVSGLQPWTVRKVLGVVYPPESASVIVDTSRLSMQLGCSLADFSVSGRGLLSNAYPATARSLGCRLLWSQTTQEVATREIFSGIPPTPVGESRRAARTPPPSRLEGLARMAQLLRSMQEIATGDVGSEKNNSAAILPQVEQLLQGQEPEPAGRLLFWLAQQFISAGQYSAADNCLAALVDRFPDHALNDAALLWLIRYHSSVEMQQAFGPLRLTRLPSVLEVAPAVAYEAGKVHPASFELPNPTAPQVANPDELLRIVGIGERIRQLRPALYADPRVQFPLVSVQRRLGKTSDAARLLNVLTSSQLAGQVWRIAARGEQDLLERPAGPISAFDESVNARRNAERPVETEKVHTGKPWLRPGRQTITAARVSAKPLLDGKLNDPCWSSETWVRCPSAESGPSTEMILAYDDEFLFVALRCTRVTTESAVVREPRVRDAAMFGRDRVELNLDVDRDYHTYYRFTVDQHGRTHEACGDDTRWNPQWFVAADAGRSEWVIEAAIPRSELVATAPTRGETWCVRARRILPTLDVPSETESTTHDSVGGEFALLLFSDE